MSNTSLNKQINYWYPCNISTFVVNVNDDIE